MGGKKLTTKTVKRKGAPTHPGSRRAAQLERCHLRETRLAQGKGVAGRKRGAKVDKLLSIILLLPSEWSCIPDLPAFHSFLQSSFLPRHAAELSEIESQRRAGRPPSAREVALRAQAEKEQQDYETGMEVPDLLSEVNVRLLREWEGDERQLGLFRMRRISGKFQQQYDMVQKGQHKELELEDARNAAGASSSSSKTAATPAAAPAAPDAMVL